MRRAVLSSLAAIALALGLTGCGGPGAASPTATPTPVPHLLAAGTPLTFVSGETSDPAAGASVTLSGKSYTTDSAGRVITADPYDRGVRFGDEVHAVAQVEPDRTEREHDAGARL